MYVLRRVPPDGKRRIVLDLLFNVDRAMLAAYVRSEARTSANPLLLDDLDIFKNLVKVFSNRRHPFL